jgi:hypothetical protein
MLNGLHKNRHMSFQLEDLSDKIVVYNNKIGRILYINILKNKNE